MSTQSDLAEAAKCFCFNDATARAVVVYILLSKTGLLAMTPSELAIAAKNYSYDLDTWKKTVAYLLAVEAGLQGQTPAQLADASKCFCFNDGTWKKVVAYLLNAGGTESCPQDMQVAWTPTNLKLGEQILNGDLLLTGIDTFILNQSSLAQAIRINAQPITSFSAPNLTSCGQIIIDSNTNLTSVSIPSAFSTTALASLQIINNSSLSSITLGAVHISGNLSLQSNIISTVILPNLTTVVNIFAAWSNPNLTSISCPNLVNTGNVDFDGCANLVNVSMPNWVPGANTDIDMDTCALNAASVNLVLARAVANPLFTGAGSTIELNGGTNAAPSGQGIADKATLIGRGCGVTTN